MKKVLLTAIFLLLGASSISLSVHMMAEHAEAAPKKCSCHPDCDGGAPNNVCSIVAPGAHPCQVKDANKNGTCGQCPTIGSTNSCSNGFVCQRNSDGRNVCVDPGTGSDDSGGSEPGYSPPPARKNCAIPPTDIMLVIDRSNSMKNPAGPNPNIAKARSAAIAFVNSIKNFYFGPNPVRVGLAAFDDKGQKIMNPSDQYQVVINTIQSDALKPSNINGTCLECALDHPSGNSDVMDAFLAAGGEGKKKVVVILTDGNITSWVNNNEIKKCDHGDNRCDQNGVNNAKQAAVRLNDRFNKSVQFWVVQFGDTKNADVFKEIVGLQNDWYDHGEWKNVTGNSWDPLFQAYASEIRGGFIYSEAIDQINLQRYSGWTAVLSCGGGSRSTVTQSADKLAKFAGVPAGTDYKVSFTPPVGYGPAPGETNSKSAPVYPGIPPGGPGFPWGGNCTAGTADECEYTSTRFVRYGSIQGCVFNDINSSGTIDAGETYSGSVNVTLTGTHPSGTPFPPRTIQTACYNFQNLPYGTYTLSYTNIPTGYKLTKPLNGALYQNLRYYGIQDCTVTSVLNGQPSCTNGNVTNANFGITNAIPWIQTAAFNVRNDQRGFDNPIQTNSSVCGPTMMRNGNGGTSGILYTAGVNTFTPGSASSSNWIVANSASNPTRYNPGQRVKTSYDEILLTLTKNEKEPVQLTSLSGCTNLSSCTITSGLGGIQSEAYIANGNVRLNTVHITNQKAIILVTGSLRIQQNVTVDPGSFLMFVVKGDIIVNPDVGRTTNYMCAGQTGAEVQGIYVTNSNFRAEGQTCPNANRQLNLSGSIITNADAIGGGTLTNNRSLCAGNLQRPALTITPRLDFILNAPSYILRSSTSWQEVAP